MDEKIDVINLMYGPFIIFYMMIIGTLMFYFLSFDSIYFCETVGFFLFGGGCLDQFSYCRYLAGGSNRSFVLKL